MESRVNKSKWKMSKRIANKEKERKMEVWERESGKEENRRKEKRWIGERELMEEGWKEGLRWVKDGWERGDMRGEELERQKLKKGRRE